MSHTCPIGPCDKRVPSHLLMCAPHWAMVPADKRNAVWRTFKRNGVLSEEYLEARDEAIQAVMDKLRSEGKDDPDRAHRGGRHSMGARDEGDVLQTQAAEAGAPAAQDAPDP